MRTVLARVLVVAAVLGAQASASADALSDLEKAHSAYVAHKYAEAETRLRVLLDPRTGALTDSDKVADARMYLGAALLAQGKKEQAAALFEALLLDKPDYQPDSLRVSLQATDALIDARSRMRDQLAANLAEKVRLAQEEKAKIDGDRQRAALRLAMLEKFAGEETIVERNSRWLALVPFGVGQFQNGQDALGWAFLTGESLLVLGSAAGAALTLYNAGQASSARARSDDTTAPVYQEHAQVASLAGNLFAAGFALAAVAGVIHAEATFVPERVDVRKRDLPSVSLSPLLAPISAAETAPRQGSDTGRGLLVGVQGRF